MRTRWRAAAGAIALLTLTACGGYHGGAGHGRNMDAVGARAEQEVAKLLDDSVQDPERVKRGKAIVAEMIEEIKASSRLQRDFHRKLYEMNANYDAAPEDFTKILDEASNQRMRSAAMILALRFKLKETLKPDEWKALADGMNRYRSRYWQDKEGAGAPAGAR